MLKSIAVVLGSYVLSVVLVLCMDPLLSRMFPSDFVCARFAPGRAGRHVLWFFILGEVMGIVSIIPNWNKRWPHWYWLSWFITWPVACWIRLTIAGRRASQATAVIAMLGAIAGDIMGSVHEFPRQKNTDFPLFVERSRTCKLFFTRLAVVPKSRTIIARESWGSGRCGCDISCAQGRIESRNSGGD